jgi:hypothetical protein
MSSDSRKRASAPAAAEAGDERARATGESALTAAADETNLGDAGSLAAFEKWCVDRGFVLHAALELRDVTPPGSTRVSNAAFASADVRVGDVLVDIPKAWCLTPLTGSVSLAVPEEDLADLDEAALILAVMYERARGEASAWWPYFRRLPRDHEPIPLMWSDDDKKHLAGTDVASRLKSDAPALREDHARIMDACRAHAARLPAFFPDGIAPESLHDDPVLVSPESRNPLNREGDEKTSDTESLAESLTDAPRYEVEDGPFGFRAFLAAASLVASRAFHVDDAHGQGLVPVADLFNHAGGGGEHVHFEGDEGDFRHSIRDEDENADESLSESDDARVEAEMRRLAAEDDLISPSRAKETLTFEAFEALEKRGGAKLASNPTAYGDAEEEEEEDGEWESDPNASRTSDALRLVAVASARRGDELFNAFGDHGNALLLHKYGFVEWANAASSGGVTISPEQLCELIGSSEVYFEAFAALEGTFASDDEATTSDDENDEKAPWDSAADRAHPGAAAARAAGWSGGKYELSASGELSRDLLLLLAVALADGDEDDAFFQKTGLPPGLERLDDEGLLRTPGVAEAALAAIKTRLAALPKGTVTSDLATARELSREGRSSGEEPRAAPNGVAGVPAAFVLRADERATCEKALARLVRWLRRVVSGAQTDARTERTDAGDDEDARRVRPRLTDVVPLQDTPYGAVVYLPKRESFAGRKEKEARRD